MTDIRRLFGHALVFGLLCAGPVALLPSVEAEAEADEPLSEETTGEEEQALATHQGQLTALTETEISIRTKANKKKQIEAEDLTYQLAEDCVFRLGDEEVPAADIPAESQVTVHVDEAEVAHLVAVKPPKKAKKAKEKPAKEGKKKGAKKAAEPGAGDSDMGWGEPGAE